MAKLSQKRGRDALVDLLLDSKPKERSLGHAASVALPYLCSVPVLWHGEVATK